MKKIITIAGSNSSNSINAELLKVIRVLLKKEDVLIENVSLTDYAIPMYSEDIEKERGIPKAVAELNTKLKDCDAIVFSVAEHNGNISAFFKNTLDWLSRNNRDFLASKKIMVLSTSPGGGGGASALAVTAKTLPYFKGEIVASQSIGNFYKVISEGNINDDKVKSELLINSKKLIDSI